MKTVKDDWRLDDERFSVEGYAERARSAFYDVGTAGKLLTSREVVAVLTQSFPDSTRLWAEKIAGAELSIFEDILRQVSPNLISDEAVQFSLRLMAYNQRMIREVGLGY